MTAEIDDAARTATGAVPTPRTPAEPLATSPPNRVPTRPRWQRRYGHAVAASDTASVLLSTALYALWGNADATIFWSFAAVVVPLTLVCLRFGRAWDPRALGHGSVELTRLLRTMMAADLALALGCLAVQTPFGRPWVFGVVPLAGVFAALGRAALRGELYRRRRQGRGLATVLAVGTEEAVASLIVRTRRATYNGWRVTGACTPTGAGPDGTATVLDVPVVGDLDAVAGAARTGGYQVISVAPAPGWGAKRLQQLAWDLEPSRTELVVDPGLMEIAGPRLHVAAVDGQPLLRLSHPTFAGPNALLKGLLDRVLALVLIVLTGPVLLAIALAVRGDGGPTFFRQTRVGKRGREFRMVKFRSMTVDAEARLTALTSDRTDNDVLFKIKSDPRITPVGRILRKYSLDEVPQLFNVLAGSMSLVGPRPPLPCEVERYGRDARRRLLVKPGMTGLWQVSGRSDLSWEETVRLDLRYAENWTMAMDAQILFRTIGAVLRRTGAY